VSAQILEWYLMIQRSEAEKALVMGPYPTREEADSHLKEAKCHAHKADAWAWFYMWVTVAFPVGSITQPTLFGA
jgi:hypothetical protein